MGFCRERAKRRRTAKSIHVKTDLAEIDVSTLGGDLVGMSLNDYQSSADKTQRFSLFSAKHDYRAQSGLIGDGLPNHKTLFAVQDGPRELAPNENTLQLRLQAPVVNGIQGHQGLYLYPRQLSDQA